MSAETSRPTRVGRFQIIAEHGRDGIARIATGSDPQTGQMVTLDILDQGSAEERQAVIERARHCRQFTDKSVYRIIDILDEQSPKLIVREHERGMSLGQTIESEGAFDPHEAARLIANLARVLDRAHARGIVHGRLSIELIRQSDPDGPFRIAGFGRPLGALDTPGIHPERLRYAAPEQIRGDAATDRSDLYALGLIFYSMLAGRPAFEAQDQMLLAAQVGEGDMPSLADTAPHVPEPFRELVEQLTRIDPKQRIRTGNALAEAIERVMAKTRPVARPDKPADQQPKRQDARRPTPIYWPGRLLLMASIAMLVAGGYLFWQDYRTPAPTPAPEPPTLPSSEPPARPAAPTADRSSPPAAAAPRSTGASEAEPIVEDWQAIAEQARQQGCTQIEQVRGSGGVLLDGIIDDPTRQIELDARLRAAGVDDVTWTRLAHDSPACGLLETIMRLTSPAPQRLLRSHAGSGQARTMIGDLLVLDIDAPLADSPSGAWYVQAGYLTGDGQIIHLTQGAHAVTPLEPGSAVRIGEPSKGEWFRLAPPAGVDVAFALLTSVALPAAPERIEPAETAAARLQADLADIEPPAWLSILPVTIMER